MPEEWFEPRTEEGFEPRMVEFLMGEEGFEPRTVEFLKGDGPLASKKWCKGAIACVIKANSYRKENRHSEGVPLSGVCVVLHAVLATACTPMVAQTLCIPRGGGSRSSPKDTCPSPFHPRVRTVPVCNVGDTSEAEIKIYTEETPHVTRNV